MSHMKRVKHYLLACFLLAGIGIQAQNLTKIYSGGNSLPTEEGWQELKLNSDVNSSAGAASATMANNAVKITAEQGKHTQMGWYQTGLGLDQSKGYTIEIRAKVINAANYGAFTIQGYDNEGRGFRLGIYKDFLAEMTNPLAATNVLKSGMNNSDAFHTYRIAVKPDATVTVYRDKVEIGTFPRSIFYFDNIIENGGFEDGASFPDFMTQGNMYRTDNVDGGAVKTGNWALIMDNENKVTNYDDLENPAGEKARTREIAIKQGTKYDISVSRKRLTPNDERAYRDFGAFYNTQAGTQGTSDERNNNAMFAGANDDWWQVHNQQITTPTDENVKSLRFEFPSWRDGDRTSILTAFDDFYLSENLGLQVAPDMYTIPSMDINYYPLPDTYVNLIQNGDFEDHTINNDGTPYEWALSQGNASNEPIFQNVDPESTGDYKENTVWDGRVRLQVNFKDDEDMGWAENKPWAHSGTSSIRITSQGKGTHFKFTKELEADKEYCFNFWMRLPKWNDGVILKANIGDSQIWTIDCNADAWDRFNHWKNVNFTFTTTEENKTLTLFTDGGHGDWYNVYFDDMVLYEVTPQTVINDTDPDAGKVNLFKNGDFEDETIDNNGAPYEWALASNTFYRPNSDEDLNNYPVAYSDFWGAHVRLQNKAKNDDIPSEWAHSGDNSLRISRLDDRRHAQIFEGITEEHEVHGEGSDPAAWRQNIHMEYELEANKTYTFVFWIKTAAYGDWGALHVDNGSISLWRESLSRRYSNGWFKQRITFTTTEANRTLKMYTTWGGWFNFYIDDIALYKEETTIPFEGGVDSYLFFGKSTGTQAADVEIEYVAVDNTGAHAPDSGSSIDNLDAGNNMNISTSNGNLIFEATNPASVQIYNVSGMLVSKLDVQTSKTVTLPKGVYIVKAVSNGNTETYKVRN